MSEANHRMRLKYKDFEFEAEGDREFVESRSSDVSSILSMLVRDASQRDADTSSKPQESEINVPNQTTVLPEHVSRPTSVGEFLVSKGFHQGPDTDLVLGIGYFIEKFEDRLSFSSRDIKEYCQLGKCQEPSNISDCIARNIRKGLVRNVDIEGRSGYQLTLTGVQYIEEWHGVDKTKSRKSRSSSRQSKGTNNVNQELLDVSLDEMNLALYPDVNQLQRTEDLALATMAIYSGECQVEYLSNGEIAEILRQKFSVSTSADRIGTALRRAKPKVESRKIDGTTKWRLMRQGKTYVDQLREQQTEVG